jgi:hypothetical protein
VDVGARQRKGSSSADLRFLRCQTICLFLDGSFSGFSKFTRGSRFGLLAFCMYYYAFTREQWDAFGRVGHHLTASLGTNVFHQVGLAWLIPLLNGSTSSGLPVIQVRSGK